MASESLWHQHAALFRRLYIDENKPLKQVKSEAEGAHGFPSNSLYAYETKLRDVLGLRKNLTPEGWVAIGQRIRSNENRKWDVYIHGRKASRRKVMKEIGRYGKHELSSRNLPMPHEAKIKWVDASLSQAADMSIGDQRHQQRMLLAQPDSVLTFSSNEDLEMVDYNFTLTARSPSDVLQETKFLWYNRPGIIDQTIDIAFAAKKYISIHFCAAILDPRLEELWDPMLNNLPFFSLTGALDRFRVRGNFASPHGTSMMSILQTTHTQNSSAARPNNSSRDANVQDMSGRGDAADDANYVYRLPTSGTLSTGFDPFRVLGLVVYCFSNQFEDLEQVEGTMRFLMEKVSLKFVGEFLRAGTPAIEESWMHLAEWSFELGEKRFFEQVMQVSLSCPEWVQLNGARSLALAANLGCTKVVRTIIELGVSPNEFSNFSMPKNYNGATPGFSRLAAVELTRISCYWLTVTTCPLLEAAVRSRLDILVILKDANADCQLRLNGLTITGNLMSAHQSGLIDMDELSLVVPLLMSMGEDVDAPMRQFRDGDHCGSHIIAWSEETLLDAIYLTIGGCSLFKEVQERSHIPHGVFTVSGILQSAEDGPDAIRHYMTTTRYPSGWPRKRIEEIALLRSLKFPTAFKSMMEIGFTLKIKTLINVNSTLSGHLDTCRWDRGSDQKEDIWNHYFLDNLPNFPVPVLQYLVDHLPEDKVLEKMKARQYHSYAFLSKLSPDQLRRFGTKILETAMGRDDYRGIKACIEAGVSLQEVDALKLAICGDMEQSFCILLHDHGARLVSSPQVSKSLSLQEFSTKMLHWLISHLPDLDGKRKCDIVTQFLATEVDWTDSTAREHWINDCYCGFECECYCGFECECSQLDSKVAETYKDSTSTFLALLICLGNLSKLISKLLDEGLDLSLREIDILRIGDPRSNEEDSSTHESELEATVQDQDIPIVQEHQADLEDAIQHRNILIMQTLLDRGYDINHCDAKGRTALEFAVECYLEEYEEAHDSKEATVTRQLVIVLLENGADPNFEHYDVFETVASPSLVRAVKSVNPDLQLIQMLLRKGARADTYHEHSYYGHKSTLLSYVLADEQKDLQLKKEIFALLLAHGARYDKYDELCTASRSGDIELVRFHLDNGADPNQLKQRSRYDSPLEESASAGNIPLTLILLAAGSTLSGDDHSLSTAAANGRLDMVALLLPHEKRLEEVERALKRAVKGRFYSIVQLLRQAKENWEA